MRRQFLAALAVMAITAAGTPRAEDAVIPLPSGEVLDYALHASTGASLLLWFASERGFAPAETQAARDLAARGVEVWQFDLLNALFLPPVSRSLDGISSAVIGSVLDRAQADGRKLAIYAEGRAAVPVLNGLAGRQTPRTCLLLMYPNFYARAEALSGAEYLAFGDLAQLDILVLQPRQSAATPWIDGQLTALAGNGARTGLRMLERLREGFWRREDATAFEIEQGGRLADLMLEWMGQGACH